MRQAALLVAGALVVAGCAQAVSAVPPAEVIAAAPTSTAVVSAVEATPAPRTSRAATVRESPPAAATTSAPVFSGEIVVIDDAIAARMTASWRPGCPVGLDELRLLRVAYHDFAGEVSHGEIVVHVDVAAGVLGVFEALFDAGFPIERMELVDVYGGDDDASMAANNTSGFNCRFVAGTTRWSEHAYGAAIDLNPLINPYVRGSTVDPPAGTGYVDRSFDYPGMIHSDDRVVTAFAAIGWTWGGTWQSAKDYQHFSLGGR